MTGQGIERRLAAILSADVVGYSRLMEADEVGTLARLQSHRRELLDPIIAEHNGRIVKLMGDGTLVEFASVVDAIHCAVDIQKGMAERHTSEPVEQRIEFRIGINLGDVIVEGDDIYGDGVNVAARIQGLADPGSVCVSGMVFDSAKNKLELGFTDLGAQTVKNIREPVRVYRVRVEHQATPAAAATLEEPQLRLPDKPSLAVLPFHNMSGDSEQEYFADGITEDVITALSRVRWIFVIARNSTFTYKGRAVDIKRVAGELGVRYVLEGSVRKGGNRVRITAQLIDGPTGNHVWAKRYDRDLEDIFALQDELTETIVGAIEPELGKAERQRAKLKRPENLDAWDLYQQGASQLYRYTKDALAEAQRLFREATGKDPHLGPAYSGSAEVYYYSYVYGFADSLAECREKALSPARRAVELDHEDASAHCTLGRVHYLRREHDSAIPELEIAIDLNPSLALAHYGLGAVLVFSGKSEDAIPRLEAAVRLSPHDPNMGSFMVRLADAHFFMDQYEDAIGWARRALRQPGFQWSRYAVLIAALGHLDRAGEARRVFEDVVVQRPDFSQKFIRETHLFNVERDFDHYVEGLAKAGVPAE